MVLERIVIKQRQVLPQMKWDLVKKWRAIPLETLPPTPMREIDLSRHGYGFIYIKDESVNPTGTIKDRMVAPLIDFYRMYASNILPDTCEERYVPRLSIFTAGNSGVSLAKGFSIHELPPIKLLIDRNLRKQRIAQLRSLDADIYAVETNEKAFTAEEIKALTNNPHGIDLTSLRPAYYVKHAQEVLSCNPTVVFVPYGSGSLFENYLLTQERHTGKSASILGAEPQSEHSIADKLTKKFNPFILYDMQIIEGLKRAASTGKDTGIYKVSEQKIRKAYELLNEHCPAEPSAAAGLALYLDRFDHGFISTEDKVVIVNTGKGI